MTTGTGDALWCTSCHSSVGQEYVWSRLLWGSPYGQARLWEDSQSWHQTSRHMRCVISDLGGLTGLFTSVNRGWMGAHAFASWNWRRPFVCSYLTTSGWCHKMKGHTLYHLSLAYFQFLWCDLSKWGWLCCSVVTAIPQHLQLLVRTCITPCSAVTQQTQCPHPQNNILKKPMYSLTWTRHLFTNL